MRYKFVLAFAMLIFGCGQDIKNDSTKLKEPPPNRPPQISKENSFDNPFQVVFNGYISTDPVSLDIGAFDPEGDEFYISCDNVNVSHKPGASDIFVLFPVQRQVRRFTCVLKDFHSVSDTIYFCISYTDVGRYPGAVVPDCSKY